MNLSLAEQKLPALTRQQAEQALAKLIAIATAADPQSPVADLVTTEVFVRGTWLAIYRSHWRPSTAASSMFVIERHILPRWGDVPLRDIDAAGLSTWLGGIAGKYSYSLTHKCLTYMRSILAEAVEKDLIRKNPARRVRLPETRDERAEYLTMAECQALLAEMRRERDRLITVLFLCGGFRPGELFALRWNDLIEGGVRVDEAVIAGKIGRTKTSASKGLVALPAQALTELITYRDASKWESEDFIFPSLTGAPLCRRNWGRDVLRPAAKRAKIPREKATFQAMRRTFASLAHDMGITAKSVQAQLRHASVVTTLDVYTQSVPESQKLAVELFAARLLRE